MTSISAYITIAGSLFGLVIGALLQNCFKRRNQKDTRLDDQRWEKTTPIRTALPFLLESVFAALPVDTRILYVGAGAGREIVYLARRFPQWIFVAVEPSGARRVSISLRS